MPHFNLASNTYGISGGVWPTWVNQQPTFGSTMYIDPWPAWQIQTTGTGYVQNQLFEQWVNTAWQIQTGTTAQNAAWDLWQNQNAVYSPYVRQEPRALTSEQTAARVARDAQRQREAKRLSLIRANRSHARMLRRKPAERRALDLLLEHLDDKQREEYVKGKSFTVETADGKRHYRIALGLAGNIRLIKCEGQAPLAKYGRPLYVGARFCAHVYHPDGWVPDEDNILTQKLMLESPGGEEAFLAMANVS